MDIKLYQGELQGKEITLGILKNKKILAFMRDNKYLVPRDREKKLITIPDDINVSALKKTSKEITKIIDYYLNRVDLQNTAFGVYLTEYYFKHLSQKDAIIEELDEEGKALLGNFIEKIFSPKYFKKGSCITNYWKEGKVAAYYCWLDMELILDTFLNQIDKVLLEGKKPVVTYPLRYSISRLSEETTSEIEKVIQERLKKWLGWRGILRKDVFFYNYLIHWLFEMLNAFYPENEAEIKELSQKAERAEILSKPEIITAIQQGQDYETDNFASITLNKHLLYYFSMQFLFSGNAMTFKDYNSPSFGYQDIFPSIANSYSTIPLFTAINPPFTLAAQVIVEWVIQNFDFKLLQGNPQLDPYNLLSNTLTLFLSIVSAKASNFKEMKYLAAKVVEKMLTDEIIKDAIKGKKINEMSMQGKESNDIEVTEEELKDQKQLLTDSINNYINALELPEERKKELEEIANEFSCIQKSYEEFKNEKTKHLKIDEELIQEINDFQKDFILSLQMVENNTEVLNAIAKLFIFFNEIMKNGDASTVNSLALYMWMISIANQGKIDWIINTNDKEITNEETILTKVCSLNNTPLPGFVTLEYPIAEMTSPTLIVFTANNLKEMLLLKDVSEKMANHMYEKILTHLAKIY